VTAALCQAISAHRDGGPWTYSAVPRLSLVATDVALPASRLLYDPMVCFIAQGTKRTVAGERSWLVPAGQMLLNTLHLPVTAVFEQIPYRSAVLALDGQVLTDLLLELGDGPTAHLDDAWQATAAMEPELIDAVTRYIRLLDAPADIALLGPRIETEILYRMATSPLGPLLRRWAYADNTAAQIRTAVNWVATHYADTLTVDTIAAAAAMSPATLHRHFKSATGMSPLQYQKQLRLLHARRRLLTGTTATQTAQDVGYTSATQFNREYRRFHGLPPAQDAARLRAAIANQADN